MKRQYIINGKTGDVKIEGMEQSAECSEMVDNANKLGNVVNVEHINHGDDNPVHDGVNVKG